MKMYDGNTSLGLPGKVGFQGERSRLFFYGNSKNSIENNSGTKKLKFDDNKYAVVLDGITPEKHDYILYTDVENLYEYLYDIISDVQTGEGYYECEVSEVDKMKLGNHVVNDNIEFIVNPIFRKNQISVRDVTKCHIDWHGNVNHVTIRPTLKTEMVDFDLFDISLVVPSNSTYVFDSNIEIYIEFYTIQSFIMDTMLKDKFDDGTHSMHNNTYIGYFDKFSILNGESKYNPINFDDERLENFTITIKAFDEKVGSRAISTTLPIMTTPLKRHGSNPKAFIFANIKNGKVIEKVFIQELSLEFLNSA